MKREIVSKLISTEIDIVEALFLARESATGDLKEFIDHELDGYSFDLGLPHYRKFSCPIVIDYQDPWGNNYKEVELNTNKFNQNGLNINDAFIYDGIDFIAGNIKNLSSNSGIRSFNHNQLKMLEEILYANHPDKKLLSGGYKFQKQQLQTLLDGAKKELIKMLQDLPSVNETPITKKELVETQKTTVFISYAWENDTQNGRIISFVNFLREKGYDARMDRSISQKETATNFKRMMHDGMYNSDKVIVILSEKYKKKADNLENGVGEEVKIIQEEIGKKTNKYILVSFTSLTKEILKSILPNSLSDRDILDLKKDQDENEFSELFSKLNSIPIIDFSEVSEKTAEVIKKPIKPFRL